MQPEQHKPSLDPQRALKKRKLWIGRIGCLLGIAGGLFGLLLGRMGNLWVAFDVFSQFTVQFLLLTVAFAIGILLPRAKVALSFLLFLGMLVAYGAWPLLRQDDMIAAHAGTGGGDVRSLKVLSFNTWLDNSSPNDIMAEIRRIDADVVTLVEFGSNKQPLLSELKAQYPHHAGCEGSDHCAFAILSKHPFSQTSMKMVWKGPPFLHAVLGGEFAGLNVFAVHTTRFPHSRAQFRQMKTFSEFLQHTAGPKLVMGDFNATPYSRMIAVMEREAGLTRFTSLPSWPASSASLSLPLIIFSPVKA